MNLAYDQYLKSETWERKRIMALEFWGYACMMCSGCGPLHIHHRTYENLGSERIQDLIVLCEGCHGHFHEILEKPKQLEPGEQGVRVLNIEEIFLMHSGLGAEDIEQIKEMHLGAKGVIEEIKRRGGDA